MHIEVRPKGKRKIYYLAHSFREGDRVRKIRRYLGSDISPAEIKERRVAAGRDIREQLDAYKMIKDPLHTVLSSREIETINSLIGRQKIEIYHLSKADWQRFTEIFTYNTNAIEGSTVQLKEVREILEKNKWPDRPKEEISETYGVAKGIEYIKNTKENISLGLIKELHRIVFLNSKTFAGKFREKGVDVVVSDKYGNILHRGVPWSHVTKLLKELVDWYDKNKANYHPIVLASVVHNQFENIHPFQDGNGRVGRLLLNNVLLKHGLPPVNISLKNRAMYYSALQSFEREDNLRPTIELILKEYRSLKNNLSK